MPMEGNFVAQSGLALNWKHNRSTLTHDTPISLEFTFLPDGQIDMKVSTGGREDIHEPLTTENIDNIRLVLRECRKELVHIAAGNVGEDVQSAMLWVIEALQIRMNQHYCAINTATVLSMDALMGLLTMEDEGVAESQMTELMQSLSVGGNGDDPGAGEVLAQAGSRDGTVPPPVPEICEEDEEFYREALAAKLV